MQFYNSKKAVPPLPGFGKSSMNILNCPQEWAEDETAHWAKYHDSVLQKAVRDKQAAEDFDRNQRKQHQQEVLR